MKQQIKFIGGPWDGFRAWSAHGTPGPRVLLQAFDEDGNRGQFHYLYVWLRSPGVYVFSEALTAPEAERRRRSGEFSERFCEGK